MNHGQTRPASLFAGFDSNALPTRRAFSRRQLETFFSTSRGERDDARDPKLGCLFHQPLETIELEQRRYQDQLRFLDRRRQFLDASKDYRRFPSCFNLGQVDARVVADLIEL